MKRNLTLPLIFLLSFNSLATHIKGGQISYKFISPGTVEFTFTGYRDIEGVPFGQGIFDFGDGEKFGDHHDEILQWSYDLEIDGDTEKWTFSLIHTYSSSGIFTVSYSEDFRAADILNITNSVSNGFYLESQILFDRLVGFPNSSPKLIAAHSFDAIQGERFITSFAHTDSDGDSLAYKLITPKRERNGIVNGYLLPNNSKFGVKEDAIFEISPITGNLIWDSPGEVGEYAVAVRVEEWRKINGAYVKFGFSVIDLVINVIESSTSFVALETSTFSCLDLNQDFLDSITLKNPSNLPVKLKLETDATGLIVNDIGVEEWNKIWEDSLWAEDLLKLVLKISAENLQDQDDLRNIVLTVEGNVPLEGSIKLLRYSTNSALNVGCSDEIVAGFSEEVFFNLDRNKIEVNFKNSARNQLSVYTLDGALVKQSEILNSSIIKLTHPFEDNIVYVLLIQSSTQMMMKKIRFTSKD